MSGIQANAADFLFFEFLNPLYKTKMIPAIPIT